MVGLLAVLLLAGVAFGAWGVVRGDEGGGGVRNAPFGASATKMDWVGGEDVTVVGEVVENTADACPEPAEPNQCIADAGNRLVLDLNGERVAVEYSYGE